MSKITAFGPSNLDEVRQALVAALKKVEDEFGIKCKIGKMGYTSEAFKVDLSFMTGADDPMMEGVDPKFVQECLKYRETKDLFKKEFKHAGSTFTCVGIKPRTTGSMSVARCMTTQRLKLIPTDVVRAGLAK